MNAANRVMLRTRLGASQNAAADMQGTKSQLENLRDGLIQRIGGAPATPGAGAPSGGGTPGPSAAPVTQPSPASSTAGAPSGRPPNWADASRASAGGGSANLPGRSASPPPRATPAAAQPQAKVATQAQVNAYAQKKGITPAAALQEFKAAHYSVQ